MSYPMEHEVLNALNYSYDIDFRNSFFDIYRFISDPRKQSVVLSSLVEVLKPMFYDTYESLCLLSLSSLEIDIFMSSIHMLRTYCNAMLAEDFIDSKWRVLKIH